MIHRIVLVAAVSYLIIGCAPHAVRRQATPVSQPRVAMLNGDTISYIVEFSDPADREHFLSTFRNFLKQYPFSSVKTESGYGYVLVRLMPPGDSADDPESVSFSKIERSEFVESIIENSMADLKVADSAMGALAEVPLTGGIARIYLDRGSIDKPFSSLVRAFPFSRPGAQSVSDSVLPYLTVVDSSQRKISLRIEGKLVNGAGQVLSALDFVDQWTALIKNHPAEGLALFRHVDGILAFIRGEEAVVRGLGALDEKTIQIRLSTPDPHAITRLQTSQLLWSGFRTGPYIYKGRRENEVMLVPNAAYRQGRPFLDQLILRLGAESNPILSYSLGKYDAMTVLTLNDLEYARRNLLKNSTLIPISRDRYFISCALSEKPARMFVESLIDAPDMLRNFVKAEGRPIYSVETDSAQEVVMSVEGAIQKPLSRDPIRILFRSDDPVSKTIAEKLLADLTHAGVPSALKPADERSYQTSLVMRDYGCAVGWVSEITVSERSEQLRLAALWFEDRTNPQERVREYFELPLFSVDRFLLAKNRIALYRGRLAGMYLKKEE